MKKILIVLCSLFSFFASEAQSTFSTPFKAEKRFLQIPIKNGAANSTITVSVNNEKVRWFTAELAEGKADWFAYLDIAAWKGRELTISVDGYAANGQAFKPVAQADVASNPADYREPRRSQFHFSPRYGWINDPNGLVYYQGEYHLFFQHNPYGVNWGNMHWGHAVSKDLIKWEELGEALYPDDYGTMFSGGAVVDLHNRSGLGTTAHPPMVLYYTAAEKSWMQGLAYSTDGRSFKKLEQPILPKVTDGNRDPKVIWYEPGQHWVMVLYVTEKEEQHSMHFFTSTDMKSWTFTSKLNGGKGGDRYLFECPEFYELPVIGGNTGEKKWVLTGANSQYAIGTFDGKTFHPEEERMFSQQGRDYYAAQTFSNVPGGQRIEIGWWRTHTNQGASSFNQSMSIPMQLSLKKTPRGIRLIRQPIAALASLRTGETSLVNKTLSAQAANPLAAFHAELAELQLQIKPNTAKTIEIKVRGLAIQYQVADEELVIDNVRTHVPLLHGELQFTIYVDRTGIELFANDGEVFMPINHNLDPTNLAYGISCTGGTATLQAGKLYTLQGIW
ncbi:glycoside hydrolase family 32 protein [Sphingobacterium oryzagri]|uniref:Glycoside hydrolase family 32 protein n=1 Tax=Sphingobacterium oryzagri TaxID=3025669 RepID=A0ABY7WNX2_9SPHI|nr:glycoside hydrolase family 32 protein [Sphingobacterium sp. KACC 22765]WDF70254.1 glycoside hydrolase family 32 protein [Sphingobacterium sp. KACC 22765]